MKVRTFWVERILGEWRRKTIVWLTGVRRVGKTRLCQSLPGIEYLDCELPRVRAQLGDPEAFLDRVRGKSVALDEIHRLDAPTELLKIAADHYPDVHLIATGSSTLAASAKFADTLTGRKATVALTPMTLADLADFGKTDLVHRLHRGGLPPFFLAESLPEPDFPEWLDSYWARDIQELFRIERRAPFLRFVELVLARSGGIFEATAFAGPCEVARTTIVNYLAVLEATLVAHVVRPWSARKTSEILAAPKVYAFDTGFVAFARGWNTLRPEDLGSLWEHLVLNEIRARLPDLEIRYWREKHGREIDFVALPRGKHPIAIECKWSHRHADQRPFGSFRRIHPGEQNYVVAADVSGSFPLLDPDPPIQCIALDALIAKLASS